MSRPALYPPEIAKERRKAQIREGVAKHHAHFISLTRLEQAAYKARASLGEDYAPYTVEEAEAVASLKARIAALEAEASTLNALIRKRLESQIGEDPRLAPLLSEVINGTSVRVDLKPF